ASRALVLVAIARVAIAKGVAPEAPAEWNEEWLRAPGASFVTLRLEGALRGCIGSIEARRPLGDDVAYNAYAAAYRDPRFAPLAKTEMPRLAIEVSVLSAREPLPATNEREALERIRPGVDGVYLEYHGLSATFLPQVWEGLPDPREFLGELRRKAGLSASFWDPELRLSRYTVEKYL
ncbi:MAG TPA: AmmeMemoRadiSam system protein A, partial [Usitatibacter sp.]|nr:AmmeMemoRadiSam system protein A [Usitatibacter sp.]